MKTCPFCGSDKLRVNESRYHNYDTWRERICLNCGRVVYSVERIVTDEEGREGLRICRRRKER